jgi:hypothetical protein
MSPLSSHPVPSAQQDEDAEEHLDEFCSIRVVQRPGYNCSVVAEARLSIEARTLWEQALCHPVSRQPLRRSPIGLQLFSCSRTEKFHF